MSILTALKKRGAKGKNIEEAVKTLPLDGGGGEDNIFYVDFDYDGEKDTSSKTFLEIDTAFSDWKTVVGRTKNAETNGQLQQSFMVQPQVFSYNGETKNAYTFTFLSTTLTISGGQITGLSGLSAEVYVLFDDNTIDYIRGSI